MKIVMVILINMSLFSFDVEADPAGDGKQAGAQALELIGSVKKLKENVITPMTADDRRGGDISSVYIRQDSDLLDGVIDYSSYAPVPRISGVCADGVISCAPGSWNERLSLIYYPFKGHRKKVYLGRFRFGLQ